MHKCLGNNAECFYFKVFFYIIVHFVRLLENLLPQPMGNVTATHVSRSVWRMCHAYNYYCSVMEGRDHGENIFGLGYTFFRRWGFFSSYMERTAHRSLWLYGRKEFVEFGGVECGGVEWGGVERGGVEWGGVKWGAHLKCN